MKLNNLIFFLFLTDLENKPKRGFDHEDVIGFGMRIDDFRLLISD